MSPTPQEPSMTEQTPNMDCERVVISGMAGLYPQSRHVKDLANILYNKENPISSEALRYEYKHPEVVDFSGSIPDLDRFDAQFFKVHYRLGNSMDPMSRKLLEQTYQAIYDAGMNPEQLSGRKVGVFVGSCFSETEKTCFYESKSRNGFGIAGCSKAMFANRISYWLNAKGPSMSIDEGCCSSAAALEQAFLAMSRGDCEAAVVGGAFICLHPQSSVHYGRSIELCTDGKTKAFAQNADGCAKSEAVNVLFLQKAKDAVRIYADVIHTKTEYIGLVDEKSGPKYGFFRKPRATVSFLNRFYKETNVPPQAVEYVEAFGSALPDIDKTELQTIDEVFCKNRNDPVLVGSVMSNIGYNEAASGISAVTKVLLGYHFGELAANLHCEQPRQDVAALRVGRVRLLTERRRFGRGYVAVNGMSVTGVNSHTLLHGYYKPKDSSRYKSNIPRLVTISARQESGVTKIIEDLKSRPIDAEELALLHNIHQYNVSGHLGRGFVVLDTNAEQKTVSISEKAAYFDDAKRPLWFVYSGMGSQWPGMGATLMRIPIFAAAIERCHKVLQPKGINIVDIITSPDENMFDNILHSFVGIAAVQIGLTDILNALGLVPDGIIGHSVGELGCAYADDCLTAEEMILSAYSRGLVSLQTPFIRGSMAAVGMGYTQIVKMCPPEIEVACHNGPESSTISGPADVMRTFVAELTTKGIFAKEVPCSNIAYHSRYITDAGPGLLKYLKEVIKTPRARSSKWISSSVPEDKWNDPIAKFSSAEYHTNNLLSPVLFEETSRLIPSNAVLVEVAPHGLLQAILKRSLSPDCVNIPLTRRKHKDNTCMVLEAIGKLYMEGYNPKIQNLYPKVQFPVSTGTPLLSHFVEWAHGEKWAIPYYSTARRVTTASCKLIISLFDTEYTYLRGNVIRGQILYPFAAALVAVWDTLAMVCGVPKKEVSVEFNDVHLYSQPILHDRRQLCLEVVLHRGSGSFEITEENNSKIATGIVNLQKNQKHYLSKNYERVDEPTSGRTLTGDDIYQWLEDRDYSYSDKFRSIQCATTSLSEAQLLWDNNWAIVIDGMLQLIALRQPHNSVSTPTYIRRLGVDVNEHRRLMDGGQHSLRIEHLKKYDVTRCNGIFIENVQVKNLPSFKEHEIALDMLKFIPNFMPDIEALSSLQVYAQILAENLSKETINILGITDYVAEKSVFDYMDNISTCQIPGVIVKYKVIPLKACQQVLQEADAIVVKKLSSDNKLNNLLYQILPQDKFLISEEEYSNNWIKASKGYRVLCSHNIKETDGFQSRFDLVYWRPSHNDVTTKIHTLGTTDSAEIIHVSSIRNSLEPAQKLIILAPYPSPTELKKLVRCWRKENERNSICLVIADDVQYAKKQFHEIGLAFNVMKKGKQGGEYYLRELEPKPGCSNITLISKQIGHYNSLAWVESPEPVLPTGTIVQVVYSGLTNTDFKKANGFIQLKGESDNLYGMDFSGITKSGERVMGMLPKGACSKQIRAVPELLWPVPEHWSLEDAATVPSAYLHAMYLLAYKGHMKPGNNVLIHGGAGALGQAAIAVALAHDCTVFTTVSDVRKKRFLLRLFPSLKDKHIGNSRDSSFKDMVVTATKGIGCDIVISTIKGELKNNNFECCAFLGTVVDASQLQDRNNYSYGMSALWKMRSYSLSDVSSLLTNSDRRELKQMQIMLSDGIARGFVRPLTRVTFAAHDAARAFCLLAASAHCGRVLLAMPDAAVPALPRIACNADSSHLIVCGQDSLLGLHLAERLIARGARSLHLNFETDISGAIQIETWRTQGVELVVSCCNLDTENKLNVLLKNAIRLGPVEGIYITNTSVHQEVISTLDTLTREFCPNLKYFAVISSNGDFGQNTCLSRKQNNLPATLIALPRSDDSVWSYKNAWCRFAVDATERAIKSFETVLVAHPLGAPEQSLLQKLALVADITLNDQITNETKLQEIVLVDGKMGLISNYLANRYNIYYDATQVAQLTIKRIKNLEIALKNSQFKRLSGLGKFISYVDFDELLATTEVVSLPTMITGELIRDDEFGNSKNYLCIVPGLEGNHERFRVLCRRLKLPALVLQTGLDSTSGTLQEAAERYAEVLLKKAGVKENFYLMGYENGTDLALEIAGALEDHGLTGTVFCVGCAPAEFRPILEHELQEFKSEKELQEAVMRHIFKLIVGDDNTLDVALINTDTWANKLESCKRILLRRAPGVCSAQYARELIESVLARIKQVRENRVAVRALRSQVVLLQSASQTPTDVSHLQRHSQQPVVVHQLAAPLEHTVSDLRCAAIINQYLHPQILDFFDKKNICESYLLNGDEFMVLGYQ